MENRSRRVGEFTNLEPGDGVQHLMQTRRDQQTVDETKDTGAERARAHNPFTTCMDGVLHRRPDVAEDGCQHQAEEAGCDRYKAFAAEEAQEVRQFDTRPAVIDGTANQTGNDTRQDAHIDGRVDSDHRFRQHEVTYRPRQRCGTGAVFRPAGCDADSENQRQVVKDCPARLGDKRNVKQIRLTESQQQRRDRQHCDREL